MPQEQVELNLVLALLRCFALELKRSFHEQDASGFCALIESARRTIARGVDLVPRDIAARPPQPTAATLPEWPQPLAEER